MIAEVMIIVLKHFYFFRSLFLARFFFFDSFETWCSLIFFVGRLNNSLLMISLTESHQVRRASSCHHHCHHHHGDISNIPFLMCFVIIILLLLLLLEKSYLLINLFVTIILLIIIIILLIIIIIIVITISRPRVNLHLLPLLWSHQQPQGRPRTWTRNQRFCSGASLS